MGVPSYARAGEIGVGKETALAVEGRAVAVKPRGEDDGDVHVTPASLQGAVRNSLKAQGSHTLPHVKGPPDGVMSLPGPHFWRDIFDALEGRTKETRERERPCLARECAFRGGVRFFSPVKTEAQGKREAALDNGCRPSSFY